MVFFSALQFVKTSTEYPKILFNYCDHARIILNFSKNICSIFVTFPKSDRRRKYTMLNYKEYRIKSSLKESSLYSYLLQY